MEAIIDNKYGSSVKLFTSGGSEMLTSKLSIVCFGGLMLLLLQGCASGGRLQSNELAGAVGSIPADYILTKSAFAGAAVKEDLLRKEANLPKNNSKNVVHMDAAVLHPVSRLPTVWLYASPSTHDFLAKGDLNAKASIGVWEAFLSKYGIPFKLIQSVDSLEKLQPGVLLMPSSVALSDRERQAVLNFRAKGGGLLGTWLTGVRSERGEWKGLDFMTDALDVTVVGTTESEEDETFLMPYGDTPVTHSLEAGVRVWLERVKGAYPLRLISDHPSARMTDWSRTPGSGKPGSVIAFSEREQAAGVWSRTVVLGYPERMWLSADPKLVEAIAHNALLWLLRQPDAYLSAWPHPFSSAAVMAVEGTENFGPIDLEFARKLETTGAKVTYFVSSDNISKSLGIVKTLQSRGHEIAYFGDRFESFRDQPLAVQSRRLVGMRESLKSSGLSMELDAGFRAPMDAYDKTTQKLLIELGFGYHVAFMDVTDSRLPFVIARPTGNSSKPMVVLPRTQQGPEEALEQGDPDEGLDGFFRQFNLSHQMGGLSVVPVPNQSLLTPEQLDELSEFLKRQAGQMWLGTARQVAHWWLQRERIGVRMVAGARGPELIVSVREGPVLSSVASIWINLPERGDKLRLVAKASSIPVLKVAPVDSWRSAILLAQLPAGEYVWELHFDKSN